MSRFRIYFDATPEVGTAPWCDRKSSRRKMIQSITDYLVGRCGADARGLLFDEVPDGECRPKDEKEDEAPAKKRRSLA